MNQKFRQVCHGHGGASIWLKPYSIQALVKPQQIDTNTNSTVHMSCPVHTLPFVMSFIWLSGSSVCAGAFTPTGYEPSWPLYAAFWVTLHLSHLGSFLCFFQGGSRTKIKNCNLILDANWAPNSIPTTPKAIQAIFVEIYHHGVFRLNISDPFFFFWNFAICFEAFCIFVPICILGRELLFTPLQAFIGGEPSVLLRWSALSLSLHCISHLWGLLSFCFLLCTHLSLMYWDLYPHLGSPNSLLAISILSPSPPLFTAPFNVFLINCSLPFHSLSCLGIHFA